MFKINANFDSDAMMKAVLESARVALHERLSAIRHPVTGEFPIIHVAVTPDGKFTVNVDGSDEIKALVASRLRQEGEAAGRGDASPVSEATQSAEPMIPKAFLSFAYEDFELAKAVAEALMANGIDTWWADWEIKAGDSLRQKIDGGLQGCTHFIALLTPRSLPKPWVQQELDAGLIRKLNHGVKLIALRSELSVGQLPPLLQGLNSPSVDPVGLDLAQLVNDIHGVTRKPVLGSPPLAAVLPRVQGFPYSPAAAVIAKLLVESTTRAMKFDPTLGIGEIVEKTGLSEEDVRDAAHELSGMVEVRYGEQVCPEDELFVRLDKYWMDWNPADDAYLVAAALVNNTVKADPMDIAEHFGWNERRLNPALAYLANRNLVRPVRAAGTRFALAWVMPTDDTRRYVKSRQ
ncbi:MAG: toll/interleukin-1 receptor domain-containing protein [Inhella sp.]